MKERALELEGIYHDYATELYSYGISICGDKGIVEDAIHDVFIYIHNHMDTFSNAKDKKKYLFASLRNKIYRMSKGRKIHYYASDVKTDYEYSAEEKIIIAEQLSLDRDLVKEMFASLSMRQREIVYLRFIGMKSFSEISEQMSINRQSAQNLFQRAINKLRGVFLTETINIER